MVKAQELINKQKERENLKISTYKKIYELVEKKIALASNSNYYYTSIPVLANGLWH